MFWSYYNFNVLISSHRPYIMVFSWLQRKSPVYMTCITQKPLVSSGGKMAHLAKKIKSTAEDSLVHQGVIFAIHFVVFWSNRFHSSRCPSRLQLALTFNPSPPRVLMALYLCYHLTQRVTFTESRQITPTCIFKHHSILSSQLICGVMRSDICEIWNNPYSLSLWAPPPPHMTPTAAAPSCSHHSVFPRCAHVWSLLSSKPIHAI